MADHDEPADFANEDIGDDGDNDFEPVFDTVDPDQAQTTEKQVLVILALLPPVRFKISQEMISCKPWAA